MNYHKRPMLDYSNVLKGQKPAARLLAGLSDSLKQFVGKQLNEYRVIILHFTFTCGSAFC
jgi:hypothetical protein